MPRIELEKSEDNGIRTVADICPQGWTVVDSYRPCTSICPWDSYGRSHQTRCRETLKQAGIESLPLRIRETITHPMGSGPGGAVRFGDSMMPGAYLVAVPDNCADDARRVINKEEVA